MTRQSEVRDSDLTQNAASKVALAEHRKFVAEYLRHFTTLATGSIVVVATFSDKLAAWPKLKGALALAISGFGMSVIAATACYTILMYHNYFSASGKNPRPWQDALAVLLTLAMWLTFLVGVISIGLYSVVNLMG